MTKTTPGVVAKKDKDVPKLQRAVVDGLESVKAQDIQVFDTEHVTALFERVIVASGTSNRQTKALAASVRDAVRQAGFAKPRIEGEDNGEWIIVDCGAVVAHIMQPLIRQYYHLEELWGEKPVKLKLGAAAPLAKVSRAQALADAQAAAVPAPGRTATRTAARNAAKKAAKNEDASATAKPTKPTKSTKPGAKKVAAKKIASKTAPAKKVVAQRTVAKKATVAVKKPAAAKQVVKKTVAVKKTAAVKKTPTTRVAAKKTTR